MLFKRITTPGIAHHSYIVARNGKGVVIDPRRDVDVYLKYAKKHAFEITHIFETHRNEDYVIGSTALQEFTGATIIHGSGLEFGYGESVKDGETIKVDSLMFKVLETPGHTSESLTYVLADTKFSDTPLFAFTGDSLFVGDTGRTDLWATGEKAARALYESLSEKILCLGDHVILCPGHGGGSVCGGAIADRNQSTIGYEKRFNKKLQVSGLEEFVKMKTNEKHIQPPIFKKMEKWNQNGDAPIHGQIPLAKPINAKDLRERSKAGDLKILDLREPHAFAGGHIPGSLNIWADGVPSYISWIADDHTPIAVVMPSHLSLDDISRSFYRIGYDNFTNYLSFSEWQNKGYPLATHGTIDANNLTENEDKYQILDVRKPSEWESSPIEGATEIFLGDLEKKLDSLDKETHYVTTCGVGHRGGVAASILKAHGFPRVTNLLGGFSALSKIRDGESNH